MPFAFSAGQHTISQKGQGTGRRYFEGGDEWGGLEVMCGRGVGTDISI